jgi:hypothetical protein
MISIEIEESPDVDIESPGYSVQIVHRNVRFHPFDPLICPQVDPVFPFLHVLLGEVSGNTQLANSADYFFLEYYIAHSKTMKTN